MTAPILSGSSAIGPFAERPVLAAKGAKAVVRTPHLVICRDKFPWAQSRLTRVIDRGILVLIAQ